MHRHDDDNVQLIETCPNCDDGCLATKLCYGCGDVLCEGCWEEHNNDAPCHMKQATPT